MKIFITGGAGYVGSSLVPELLKDYEVVVYDLFLYKYFFPPHINLTSIHGDIRDCDNLIESSKNCDVMIHLASTGAPGKIDTSVAESIDYYATNNIIKACNVNKIDRLVMASSTSQYGIKSLDINVTEDEPAEPIDIYGECKIRSEKLILESDLTSDVVFVRPSTLCGYSNRLRLDIVINALTISALSTGIIKVHGGNQMRPMLNLLDMVRFYQMIITAPSDLINRQAFNVLYKNKTVLELAEMVKGIVGGEIVMLPRDDNRSYHVNANKMREVLGFECKYTIEDSIYSLVEAYNNGLIPNPESSIYRNADRFGELF